MTKLRTTASWLGSVAVVATAAALFGILAAAQTLDFTPVTDEMLRNPSPNDWMAWRGTTKSQGYSPLDQINRRNVKELRLGMGVGDGIGQSDSCAHRLRRCHVPRQPRRDRARARRRERRSVVGIPSRQP